MPTPFYHVHVALDLLQEPAFNADIRSKLDAERCSFLFGNTAPDVQVVSNQAREETHFFTLPILPGSLPAWEGFLAAYPALARPAGLPAAQAAFMAGYLSHLLADWLWIQEIFVPVFGPAPTHPWGTFSERLYIHNVFRTFLDVAALEKIPGGLGTCLGDVRPDNWLPFTRDEHLAAWRDYLAGQLQPGATVQTVEVFAARQRIDPFEFYRLLNSEDLMEKEVFSHYSRQAHEEFRQNLVKENIRLLETYFES